MESAIPFNSHIGISLSGISDGWGEARLPIKPTLLNHIGTTHATAIYGLAEAASGVAMAGVFAADILRIRAVAAAAAVQYLKPAKSDLIATAQVEQNGKDLRTRLAKDHKVVFDVSVSVKDAKETEVATMQFNWHVSYQQR